MKPSLPHHRSFLMRVVVILSMLILAAAMPMAVAGSAAAQSQIGEVTTDSINAEMRETLEALRSRLDSSLSAVEGARDDARLAQLRVEIDEIVTEMGTVSEALNTRLGQIQGRLDTLGEPPQSGQPPEPGAVRDERTRLLNERGELNVVIEDAERLSTTANELANNITTIRRTLFTQTLFRHTELSAELFADAGNAFAIELRRLGDVIGNWLNFAARFKTVSLLAAVGLSLVVGLVIRSAGYRLFGGYIGRSKARDGQAPSYLKRLGVAFWSVVIRTMSLAAFLIASYLLPRRLQRSSTGRCPYHG